MSHKYAMCQWSVEYSNNILQQLQEQKRIKLTAALFIIANIHMLKKKHRKRSCWVSTIFRERHRHGFYHAVLPNVRMEDLRFQNYTRMTAIQFEELLSIVGPDIKKQRVIREPIHEEQRLILTLRYMYIKNKNMFLIANNM